MKENQRISLTKKLLKDALLRLLGEKELRSISITELCRESEINRATFYRHYSVPKDVLFDIENDFINELHAATKHIKAETDAQKYLEHLCLFFYEHSTLVRYFADNDLESNLELMLSDFFASLLASGDERAAADNPEKSMIINTYLSGGAYSILRRWIDGDICKSPKEIAQITLKLLRGDYDI